MAAQKNYATEELAGWGGGAGRGVRVVNLGKDGYVQINLKENRLNSTTNIMTYTYFN